MTPTPIKDRPDYEPNCYRCRERVGKPRAGVTGLCENCKDAEILSLANEGVMLRARLAELERERDAAIRQDEENVELHSEMLAKANVAMREAQSDRDRLQERLDQLAAYGAGSVEELLKMLEGLRSQADEALEVNDSLLQETAILKDDLAFAVGMARRATEIVEPLRATIENQAATIERLVDGWNYRLTKERDEARTESARLAELAAEAKWLLDKTWNGHVDLVIQTEWIKRRDAWLSNWQGGAGKGKGNG